jgi:hypothetical protein
MTTPLRPEPNIPTRHHHPLPSRISLSNRSAEEYGVDTDEDAERVGESRWEA